MNGLNRSSWEDAAFLFRLSDSRNTFNKGGRTHIDGLPFGSFECATECADEDVAQSFVYFLQRPRVVLRPLDPFEVRDRHTAGVGQNIRQNENASVAEDLVRL